MDRTTHDRQYQVCNYAKGCGIDRKARKENVKAITTTIICVSCSFDYTVVSLSPQKLNLFGRFQFGSRKTIKKVIGALLKFGPLRISILYSIVYS
jgi:hypothetical protein